MRSNNSIKYLKECRGLELFTYDGYPVWPLMTEREIAIFGKDIWLEEVSLDSKLVLHQSIPNKTNSGLVVYLEKQLEDITQLYAHLTKRSFEFITLDDLNSIPNIEVVILLNNVEMHFFETFFNKKGARPALIVGNTIEELRFNALKLSALQYTNILIEDSQKERIVGMVTNLNMDMLKIGNEILMGSKITGAEINDVFDKVYEIVHITTHSDGVDLPMGDSVMCGINYIKAMNSNKSPACIINGFCDRKFVKLQDLFNSEFYVDPRKIKSRIIILNVCWGFMTSENILHPKWNLANMLLTLPNVQCVITTYKTVKSSFIKCEQLMDKIKNMKNLIEGINEYDKVEDLNLDPIKFIILGEPILGQELKSLDNRYKKLFADDSPLNNNLADDINFWRLYLSSELERNNQNIVIKEILIDLSAIELKVLKGEQLDAEVAILASKLFQFMCVKSYLPVELWSRFYLLKHKKHTGTFCSSCGSNNTVYSYKSKRPGLKSRNLVDCPVCGITKDVAKGNHNLECYISKESISLNLSSFKFNNASVGIHFFYRNKDYVSKPLGLYSITDEIVSIEVPETYWYEGQLFIAIYLFNGLELNILLNPVHIDNIQTKKVK